MRTLAMTICMATMLSLWSGAFAAATDFNAVVRDAVAERTAPAAPAPKQQAKPQPPAEAVPKDAAPKKAPPQTPAPPAAPPAPPPEPVEFNLASMIDAAEAQKLSDAYMRNTLAVTYVGPAAWNERSAGRYTRRVTSDFIPANVPFHIPVVGARGHVESVRSALNAMTNSMQEETLRVLREKSALGPVMQWLVRRTLADGLASGASYFTPSVHPAVFTTNHFDVAALTNAAARLTLRDVPPIAYIMSVYDEYERFPLPRKVPGRDYADPQKEETFSTPFAIAVVLRAPEQVRMFRFCARTWAASTEHVEYAWKVVHGRGLQKIQAYRGDPNLTPKAGFAEILVNRRYMSARLDVAVFSRIGGGPWGPPAIISFFQPPDAVSDFYSTGMIREINYQSRVDLDDPFRMALTPLCTPRDWIDSFDLDGKGRIVTIQRRRSGSVFADRFFRPSGERVIAAWANGTPKEAVKVEYFIKDGMLDYRDSGDVVKHPYSSSPY